MNNILRARTPRGIVCQCARLLLQQQTHNCVESGALL
jgi:hypothetical protein